MQQEFRSFSFGDIRNHTHTGHYVPQRIFYRRAPDREVPAIAISGPLQQSVDGLAEMKHVPESFTDLFGNAQAGHKSVCGTEDLGPPRGCSK